MLVVDIAFGPFAAFKRAGILTLPILTNTVWSTVFMFVAFHRNAFLQSITLVESRT